jgi:hypothetical protein
MDTIRDLLQPIVNPIADYFAGLGIPEPITHWGHPLMMGIVVFVLGSFVGFVGWRGRSATDEEVKTQNMLNHRKLAPFLTLFLALGYTGGVLSLVMQGQPILESPHFWTGSIVLVMLGLNGAISITKFGGDNKPSLRTLHAYLGTAALALLFIHAFLGLNLGLSI